MESSHKFTQNVSPQYSVFTQSFCNNDCSHNSWSKQYRIFLWSLSPEYRVLIAFICALRKNFLTFMQTQINLELQNTWNSSHERLQFCFEKSAKVLNGDTAKMPFAWGVEEVYIAKCWHQNAAAFHNTLLFKRAVFVVQVTGDERSSVWTAQSLHPCWCHHEGNKTITACLIFLSLFMFLPPLLPSLPLSPGDCPGNITTMVDWVSEW